MHEVGNGLARVGNGVADVQSPADARDGQNAAGNDAGKCGIRRSEREASIIAAGAAVRISKGWLQTSNPTSTVAICRLLIIARDRRTIVICYLRRARRRRRREATEDVILDRRPCHCGINVDDP